MAEDLSGGPHVADLLGLYYLDALDDAQGDRIERHLRTCAPCGAQAEETVETVAALALLSDDERAGFVDRPAAPQQRTPPAGGTMRTGSDRPGGERGTRPGRTEKPRRAPTGPGRRPPARTRRVRAVARLGALLALTLVVGGLAVGALVRGSGDGGRLPAITAAATAEDSATGASVSVVATQQDGGVQIRASVDGLRAGTPYRLYAVSVDGQVWPVADWIGQDLVQEVTGNVPVDLSSLVFLSVSLTGDAPVVSVYLTRSGAPAPPNR